MKTPDERLHELLVSLALHPKYAFYAHIIFAMDLRLNEDINTARILYADRKFKIEISPKFLFETLPDELTVVSQTDRNETERCTLLVHEVLHALYLHNFRVCDRNPKMWNIAGDLCINQHLFKNLKQDSVLRSIGIDIGDKYNFPPNLTTEQYYEMLDSQDDQDDQQEDGTPGDGSELGNDIGNSQGFSDVEIEMVKAEIQGIANRAKQKSRGTAGSEIDMLLDWLNTESKVDWRNELRDITGNRRIFNEPTIKRRDRRQPSRMDLNGNIPRNGFTVACLVDVSGSMSNEEITKGLVELKEVCDLTDSDAWFVQVDTVASEPETFDRFTPTFSRKRSGGTYLWPGIEKLREHEIDFDALIVITDGGIESHWPEVLDIPVFFLLTSDSLDFNLGVSPLYKKFELKDTK